MADDVGQEQRETTTKKSEPVAVPPKAQALSSEQIAGASKSHPAFQMPPFWGEPIKEVVTA